MFRSGSQKTQASNVFPTRGDKSFAASAGRGEGGGKYSARRCFAHRVIFLTPPRCEASLFKLDRCLHDGRRSFSFPLTKEPSHA